MNPSFFFFFHHCGPPTPYAPHSYGDVGGIFQLFASALLAEATRVSHPNRSVLGTLRASGTYLAVPTGRDTATRGIRCSSWERQPPLPFATTMSHPISAASTQSKCQNPIEVLNLADCIELHRFVLSAARYPTPDRRIFVFELIQATSPSLALDVPAVVNHPQSRTTTCSRATAAAVIHGHNPSKRPFG